MSALAAIHIKVTILSTIVVDSRMVLSSGIGRYLRTILPVLKKMDMKLIALGNSNDIQSAVPGIFDRVMRYERSVYDPRGNLEIPILVPECDVYYSPHFAIPAISPRAKHIVATIHDMFHLEKVSGFGKVKRKYSEIMLNTTITKCDIIISVSDFTKQRIIHHFDYAEEKIRVVANCVDTKTFFRDEQRPSAIFFPFILFVGNLKSHKNLITAIKSTVFFSSMGIKLVVVGKKSGFMHGLDRETEKHLSDNHVVYLNEVDDIELRRLYSAAICLIFPSLYEGFGYPPLEAMSCGCPVVCSDIPVLRETCDAAALYCDPLDEEGFRKNIETILSRSDICDSLVNRGQERVGFFNFERFSDGILSAFGEFL